MTRRVFRLLFGLVAGGLVACAPEAPSDASAVAQSQLGIIPPIVVVPVCVTGEKECLSKAVGADCKDHKLIGKCVSVDNLFDCTCRIVCQGVGACTGKFVGEKCGKTAGGLNLVCVVQEEDPNSCDCLPPPPLPDNQNLRDVCATPDACDGEEPGASCGGGGGKICRAYNVTLETATTRFWDCKCEVPPKPVPAKK
jgi:hypothetical protein